MSSQAAQVPPAEGELPKHGDQRPGQFEPEHSAQNEDRKTEIAQPAQVETGRDQLSAAVRSLRRPADRKSFRMLCADGVMRIVHYLPSPPDQPTDYEIYDAKPMSPEMIKAYLDTRPWRQETEDRFRGVDGRKVPQE